MPAKPEHGRRLSVATWFAPILGLLVGIDAYLYQARVNPQKIAPLYLIRFARLGGMAGLVVCVRDRLRAK